MEVGMARHGRRRGRASGRAGEEVQEKLFYGQSCIAIGRLERRPGLTCMRASGNVHEDPRLLGIHSQQVLFHSSNSSEKFYRRGSCEVRLVSMWFH
jgi:hypothetical protein